MKIVVDAMGGDHAPDVVVDGSLAAHVEDTILVTARGPEVTTRMKK